jgi:hypothetical protein
MFAVTYIGFALRGSLLCRLGDRRGGSGWALAVRNNGLINSATFAYVQRSTKHPANSDLTDQHPERHCRQRTDLNILEKPRLSSISHTL